MGKSMSGPDLIDVEMMMRALEALHGGTVTLTVSPAGIGSTGGLAVVLGHAIEVVEGPAGMDLLTICNRWPCPVHKDFYSCIFEGLYRLDSKIGRSYEQQKLPKG